MTKEAKERYQALLNEASCFLSVDTLLRGIARFRPGSSYPWRSAAITGIQEKPEGRLSLRVNIYDPRCRKEFSYRDPDIREIECNPRAPWKERWQVIYAEPARVPEVAAEISFHDP